MSWLNALSFEVVPQKSRFHDMFQVGSHANVFVTSVRNNRNYWAMSKPTVEQTARTVTASTKAEARLLLLKRNTVHIAASANTKQFLPFVLLVLVLVAFVRFLLLLHHLLHLPHRPRVNNSTNISIKP